MMTTPAELAAKIEKLPTNLDRLDGIVNGPASGPGSEIETDDGLVKSVPRVVAEAEAALAEKIEELDTTAADHVREIMATPGFDTLYPSAYRTALPRGVMSGTVGGTAVTGATPGVYALTPSGGSITGVQANLVVSSATAASIQVVNPGLGSGTTPPTWAKPAGATLPAGTTLTAVVAPRVPTAGQYLALSADGFTLQSYQNDGSSTPLLVPDVSLQTTLGASRFANVGFTGTLTNVGYNTATQNGLIGLNVVETSIAFSSVSKPLAAPVPAGKYLTVFYLGAGNGAGARLSLLRPGTGVVTTTPLAITRNRQINRVELVNNHATLSATAWQLDSNGVSDTQIVCVAIAGRVSDTTPEVAALLNTLMAIVEMTRAAHEEMRQQTRQVEGAVALIDREPNAIPKSAHDFTVSPFTSLVGCTVAAGVDSTGSASWVITKNTSGTARASSAKTLSSLGDPDYVSTAFELVQADYDAAGTVGASIYQRNLAGSELDATIRYSLPLLNAGETLTPDDPRQFQDAGRLMASGTEQVEMEVTITGASGRKVYVRNLLIAPGSNAAFRLPPPQFTTEELIEAALVVPNTRLTDLEVGQAKTQRAIAGTVQTFPPGMAWEHAVPYVFRNQSGKIETLFDRSAARALISDVAWNGVEVFYSPAGSNANSGLSAASAKRSIWAAVQVANAHAEAGAVVRGRGAGGQYHYADSLSGSLGVAPLKPMAFVCDDGVPIKHIAGQSTTWPASFDATYTACVRFNRNAVHNIIATHIVDDYVEFRATQFPDGDMASVQATPGSWCTNIAAGDGDTRNYYHPIDGVMPNNETTFVTRNYVAANMNACVTDIYMEDFKMYGGLPNGDGSLNTSAVLDFDAVAYDRTISLYGMGAYYPGNPATYPDMDCFAARGSKLAALTKCVGVGAGKDVFNWHVRGSGAEPQGALEIECIGRNAGVYGVGSSRQISTAHGHAKVGTINPDYRFSKNGEVITDIEDSRRWLAGGVSEANADGAATPYGVKGANTSGVPSLFVQDHTIITPAGGRTLAAEPAKVRKKRVISVGGSEYVFGTGAEIVDDTATVGWTA